MTYREPETSTGEIPGTTIIHTDDSYEAIDFAQSIVESGYTLTRRSIGGYVLDTRLVKPDKEEN